MIWAFGDHRVDLVAFDESLTVLYAGSSNFGFSKRIGGNDLIHHGHLEERFAVLKPLRDGGRLEASLQKVLFKIFGVLGDDRRKISIGAKIADLVIDALLPYLFGRGFEIGSLIANRAILLPL